METKKWWRNGFIYLFMVLVILSCQSLSDLLVGEDDVEPTLTIEEIAIEESPEVTAIEDSIEETAIQTETVIPTSTATPDLVSRFPEYVQEALNWAVYFEDDFADPSGLWITGELLPHYRCEIGDAQYLWHIDLSEEDREERIFSNLAPTWINIRDLSISINTMIKDGCPDTAYGVAFRHYNHEAYVFTIRGDSFRLSTYNFLFNEETANPIVDWTPSDAINSGEMNELGITANGTNITLMINREIVADIRDETFTSGDVRLVLDLSASGDHATLVVNDFSLRTRASTIYEEVQKGPLFFQESFETSEHEWPIGDSSTEFYAASFELIDNRYQIDTSANNRFIEAVFPKRMDEIDDFLLKAEIGPVVRTEGSYQGVVFRHGESGYYWYGVYVDRWGPRVKALLYDEGEWIVQNSYSILIHGDQKVGLGVIALGDHFVLLAGDRIVGEFFDSSLSAGKPGIGFGLSEAGDTGTFIFSNFVVNYPEEIP